MRRLLLILCLLVPLLAAATPASAADDKRICFPQVPDCIEFSFRKFWSAHGGLEVFGLPLTPSRTEVVGGQKYSVQYFERARFEHFPENAGTPYEVQLGLLGHELLNRWDAP